MKMSGFILLLLIGLAACAWLVRRHDRKAVAEPAPAVRPADDLRPVGVWQGGLKLAPSGGYATNPATREPGETLRREEERQRPWEGRN